MNPVLTVVTPCLNAGPFLAECLASVARAPFAEHIVVDGGSTDGSPDIVKKEGVRCVEGPDSGQSQAINKGLRLGSGEIFSYLCADDYFEEGALDKVVAAFDAETDVVYGDGWFLEGASGWKRRKNAGPFSYERLRRRNFLIQPSVFFRREIFERHGGFDESLHFCMDHEYWLRIGGSTRWRYLPEPLATCRLHAGAKTSRSLGKAWREAAVMQRRYGMVLRPAAEALWMSTLGGRYYRLKRYIFAWWGSRGARR